MLTAEEQKERTAKGLCFNYDESYAPGHKCKGRLFRMNAEQQCLVEIIDQHEEGEPVEVAEDVVATTEISMQVFPGTFNPRIIRLTGWVHSRPLSVLIDNGNIHNFIQESVVTRLGYVLESLTAFKVCIGSWEYLECKEVCRQMAISIQNTLVTEDLFVHAMGKANIVLRIQWLGKLGVVTTDEKELTMEFYERDIRVRFQGDNQLADSELPKAGLRRLIVKGEVAYFCHLRGEGSSEQETKSWPELTGVLKEFEDVLADPTGLPPDRPNNHP